MAEEKKNSWGGAANSGVLKQDGRGYPPMFYQKMSVYVFLYNYIAQNLADFCDMQTGGPSHKYKDKNGNPINFDLTGHDLDSQIKNSIHKHFDWFVKNLNLGNDGYGLVPDDIKLDGDETDDEIDELYKQRVEAYLSGDGNKSPSFYTVESEVDQIKSMRDGEGLDKRYIDENTSMITNEGMQMILRAKEEKAREYFNNARGAVTGEAYDTDPKTGKPKGGVYWVKLYEAEQTKDQKLREIAQSSRSVLLKTLASAGSIGLSVVSGLGLLQAGGVAIGSFIGAAFVANPVGLAVASVVGLVAGVRCTTKALGSLWTSIGNVIGKCKDYRDFIKGRNAYGMSDGVPKGYNDIKEQYLIHVEMKDLMSGFYGWAQKNGQKVTMENFNKLYDKYWDEKIKSNKHFNKKNWAKFNPNAADQFDAFKTKCRYVFEVDARMENSPYGRSIKLLSKNLANKLVNYDLTNPNEIENIYTKKLQDPDLDFLKTKGIIKDLLDEKTKTAFTGANATSRYNVLLENCSQTLVDKIKDLAFNQSYDASSRKTIKEVLDDQEISALLKQTGIGKDGDVSDIENVVTFMQQEDTRGGTFGGEQGVRNYCGTLKQQLVLTRDNLVSGCESMYVPLEPEPAGRKDEFLGIVRGLSQRIENYNNKDDTVLEELEDDIGVIMEEQPKAYNYLTYCLNKKKVSAPDNLGHMKFVIENSYGNDSRGVPNEDYKDLGDVELRNIYAVCSNLTEKHINSSTEGLKNLAQKVISINSTTDAVIISGIRNEIRSKIGNAEVIQYFDYLIDLKHSSVSDQKFSAGYFAKKIDEITTQDVLSTKPSNESKIILLRRQILNSRMPESAKSNAIAVLNEKVNALSNAYKQNCSKQMISALESDKGVDDKFKELAEKIQNLKYSDFVNSDSSGITDIDRVEIENIGGAAKEYLRSLYRERIEHIVGEEISRNPEYSGENGAQKILELFEKIEGFKRIPADVKQRLRETAISKVQTAFTAQLNQLIAGGPLSNKEKFAQMNSVITGEFPKGYGLMLEDSEKGQDVKNKIKALSQAENLYEWTKVTLPNGENTSDDPVTKAIGAIYLCGETDRGNDKLSATLSAIKTMATDGVNVRNLKNESNPNCGTIRDSSDAITEDIINMVKNITNKFAINDAGNPCVDLSSIEESRLKTEMDNIVDLNDKQDMLAALLVLKRQFLGLYKTVLYKFIKGATGVDNPSQEQWNNAREREEFKDTFTHLKNKWAEAGKYIDTLCKILGEDEETVGIVRNITGTNYAYGSNLGGIVSSVDVLNFPTYASEQQLSK